jgi:hypothetical protein
MPTAFDNYIISTDVLHEAIDSFNKELDTRSQVSEVIAGVKVDVLRLKEMAGNIMIWMSVKENDKELVDKMNFSLSGLLVFTDATETVVEQIIIEDLLYHTDQILDPTSIFKKKKHESTSSH